MSLDGDNLVLNINILEGGNHVTKGKKFRRINRKSFSVNGI